MYVVVEFIESQPAHKAALRQALGVLARQMLDKKLGCLVFDVASDEFDEAAFLLYQVFASKAAHVAHVELPDYADHRMLVDPWTRTRRQLTYELFAGSRNAT